MMPTTSTIHASRRRDFHGAVTFGDDTQARVFSMRSGDGAVLELGASSGVVVTGRLSAQQARLLARALVAAAAAVEGVHHG